MPKDLIANPQRSPETTGPSQDVLSDVLRSIRLSGSLQFCFAPSGQWETGGGTSRLMDLASASNAIPFHVVVEGTCWLKMSGREHTLEEGDVAAFPFGTGHQLGAGDGGTKINPVDNLPAKPWQEVPLVKLGNAEQRVRILCGFLYCDALNFRPLRASLPELLHVRTKGTNDAVWLRGAISQMVLESDYPRPGGLSMLERLTEIIFIEVLRHQILSTPADAIGWLAALADSNLAKCLALIHDAPKRNWTVENLSAASGLSRSTLAERFEAKLGTSPMKYVRDWRLCLASSELATTSRPIAKVAGEAGYGTEAAFNRAFSRAYGVPPAAWRQQARRAAR